MYILPQLKKKKNSSGKEFLCLCRWKEYAASEVVCWLGTGTVPPQIHWNLKLLGTFSSSLAFWHFGVTRFLWKFCLEGSMPW